jgi:hypothetical protein
MNAQKVPTAERRMISIGLLLVCLPFLINTWVHVPDLIRGALMGIGLGMEIVGIVRLNRKKRAGATGC